MLPTILERPHKETIERLNYLSGRFIAAKDLLVNDLTVSGRLYSDIADMILFKIANLRENPFNINKFGFETIENLLCTMENYQVEMDRQVELAKELLEEVFEEEQRAKK